MEFHEQVPACEAGECPVIVASGHVVGGAAQEMVAALVERSVDLADTEIFHILTLGSAPYSEARYAGAFRHDAFFIGPNVRPQGVVGFTADVLADNREMLDILLRRGCELRRSLAGGVYHLELRFHPAQENPRC